MTITALPGRHAPRPLGRLLPPVMGSLLGFGPAGGPTRLRLYISGDTLMYDELAEVQRRHPDIDAGIVHLGGTRLLGLLTVTMDGDQGARWTETAGCATVVPVHYDDYTVMRSPFIRGTPGERPRKCLSGGRETMSDPLDDDDLAVAMEILGDWHREGGALVRVVRLPPEDRDRLEAAVRAAADELDHPARISHDAGASRFTLPSTDAGRITGHDVELACRIDDIVDTTAGHRRR